MNTQRTWTGKEGYAKVENLKEERKDKQRTKKERKYKQRTRAGNI